MSSSIVHHHILAIINSVIETEKKEISILDAGCGNCMLISLICKKLTELRPSIILNIYGFDVSDSQVQKSNFMEESFNFLKKDIPNYEWSDKLKLISSDEIWPYDNEKFDFVISNQVMEHVFDHDHFFSEMYRVLKIGGNGIHIFSLKHYIFEGHLHLPFVHRITNWDYLYWYIKVCSRIGLGKYKKFRKENQLLSLNDFSRRHADYMVHNTNYMTKSELYRLTKKYHFRSSFRYSVWMYVNKIRSIFKMDIIYNYNKTILVTYLAETLLLRLSSMTLFLEKNNTYR